MKKMRWGLVGATIIGRDRMIEAIRAGGGEIVAVMSTDVARGRAYADEFDIPQAVTTLPDLFMLGIDAAYISTTNERHLPETLAAAAAGVHVLCEKPLATRLEDARAMVTECEKAGVVLAVNHQLRTGAVARALRDTIRGGEVGRPLIAKVTHAGYLPERMHGWRLKQPQAGAGAVFDLAVHDADFLRFILDDEPETVSTFAQNSGLAAPGIDDAALTIIRFKSGLLAHLFNSFTTPHAETGVEVHGTAGSLIATDCLTQVSRGDIILRNAAGQRAIELDHRDFYLSVVEDFHNSVARGQKPSASGEDGLKSLAVALAALDSDRSGKAVAVDLNA